MNADRKAQIHALVVFDDAKKLHATARAGTHVLAEGDGAAEALAAAFKGQAGHAAFAHAAWNDHFAPVQTALIERARTDPAACTVNDVPVRHLTLIAIERLKAEIKAAHGSGGSVRIFIGSPS